MTKGKGAIIKVLATFALLFCAVAAILLPLRARQAVAEDDGFAMEAAEVRTDEHYGIRFTAVLKSTAYDEASAYYMMILPQDWRVEYGLSEGDDYYDMLTNEEKLKPEEDFLIMKATPVLQESGEYHIYGSIANVLYENTNREFFGVAFGEKSDGTRTYASEAAAEPTSLMRLAVNALTDENAEYTEEQNALFTGTLNTAYNVLCGNAEGKQTPWSAAAQSRVVTLSESASCQLEVKYAKELGLPVVWTSSDEQKATVDGEGNVTALVNDGSCTITASVLGQNCLTTVRLRPAMAGNMLEDFSHASSALNMDKSSCASGWSGGTWLESFEGRSGVACGSYNPSTNALAVRFNRSEEELLDLDFDYITVRLWMDYDGDNHNFSIGSHIEGIPCKTWVDFTVTKDEMISTYEGETTAARYAIFCETFANTGTGRFLFSCRDPKVSIPVYIDSIEFINIKVNRYQKPSEAGQSFTIPDAAIVGIDGKKIFDEYTVSAKVGSTELTIADGKFTVVSGTTTVEYAFVYNGVSYRKSFTFKVG